MHGLINKSIEELVTTQFGADKWEEAKRKSGVKEDYFISNQTYEDEITFDLVVSIAEVLEISTSDVLKAFGEWWILKTGRERYGTLMESGGSSLRDFLINLPSFHTRVMFMFPNISPPEFKISDIEEKSLHVHYYSTRMGLSDFVIGLLQGLSKLFDTPIRIEQLSFKDSKGSHDIYKVSE